MEEFSYLIKAGQIKDQPHDYHLSASETQRAALAKRFDLPGICRLDGHFRLKHERGGVILAALTMHADITQICVVTLEPFDERLEEETTLRFVPAAMARSAAVEGEEEEEDITPESFDSPDEIFYEHDQIDLGAALSEQLALALNPYPRKPGATLPDAATDETANPFAVLRGKLDKKPK